MILLAAIAGKVIKLWFILGGWRAGKVKLPMLLLICYWEETFFSILPTNASVQEKVEFFFFSGRCRIIYMDERLKPLQKAVDQSW